MWFVGWVGWVVGGKKKEKRGRWNIVSLEWKEGKEGKEKKRMPSIKVDSNKLKYGTVRHGRTFRIQGMLFH